MLDGDSQSPRDWLHRLNDGQHRGQLLHHVERCSGILSERMSWWLWLWWLVERSRGWRMRKVGLLGGTFAGRLDRSSVHWPRVCERRQRAGHRRRVAKLPPRSMF